MYFQIKDHLKKHPATSAEDVVPSYWGRMLQKAVLRFSINTCSLWEELTAVQTVGKDSPVALLHPNRHAVSSGDPKAEMWDCSNCFGRQQKCYLRLRRESGQAWAKALSTISTVVLLGVTDSTFLKAVW